ncbi:lipoprotein [Candidatus Steffania adelgidicola]|uniref:LptM family lipoprotein n=1 Tax=Candidatus Steffania adelgidicola TaxID=1076626 RepID=UPI001D029EC7|nr:hypothetical protein [Candidatus Steffania adelgidicola]UDG80066.1 hypothetical protein GFK82_00621 [Candidatus Steffania adelgidicola]
MKNTLRYIIVRLIILGLYGCGLKGPIDFPVIEKTDKREQQRHLTSTPFLIDSLIQRVLPSSNIRRDSIVGIE